MHHFWSILIEPILRLVRPGVIVEIGADFADHTRLLLDFCEEQDAVLHSIDPFPKFDVENLENRYGRRFILHRGLSLNTLPLISRYDAVLIDGDHNWYTVFNELKLIEKTCLTEGRPFPLVFLHDIEWPYARRDLYYYPENIPDYFRKPYKQWGISPDSAELIPDGGLNRHLNNAIYENSIQNGVLTAVEDFLRECRNPIRFFPFPGLCGIGLLFPPALEERHPGLLEYIEKFQLNDSLKRYFGLIERERNRTKLALSEKNEDFRILQEKDRLALQQHREDTEARNAAHGEELQKLKEAREKEAKHYQEQIGQSQEQIRQFQERAAALNRALDTLKKEAEALKRDRTRAEMDVERTVRWIEDLLHKNGEILRSKRWKTGDFIADWGRRLLFRPQAPAVKDYFDRIREDFTRWSGSRPKPSAPSPEEEKKNFLR